MEWNTGGSGSIAGNSPSGGHSPNQHFVKKMDEWEKLKNTNGIILLLLYDLMVFKNSHTCLF